MLLSYSPATFKLFVNSYKYLGVYMDEHLDFGKCSQVLTESASQALGGVNPEGLWI